MRALAVVLSLVALMTSYCVTASAAPENSCGGLFNPCSSVKANAPSGEFQGLIALSGDASFLHAEAPAASGDGCAHCVWTVLLDCHLNSPGGKQVDCNAAHNNPQCKKGQLADRIFLSRPGFGYGDVGTYCIGGANQIVPLSQIAIDDVNRYLKDVKPPSLDISFNPGTSLAGLATRVSAEPDRALRPVPFGGQGVTETITLAPVREVWSWGDGQTATFTDATIRTDHTYGTGGHLTAAVTTTWGATYRITYQGLTFGPYNATGRITGRQTRPVTVVTSTPVLVSHG